MYRAHRRLIGLHATHNNPNEFIKAHYRVCLSKSLFLVESLCSVVLATLRCYITLRHKGVNEVVY